MGETEGLEAALMRHEALLERMMIVVKGHLASICRAQDLTPPQLWALQNIENAKSLKVSPLAACLGLSMGATSTLVDRLVSRDLVTRTPDPDDRRAVFVAITEKGAQAVGMVRNSRRALFSEVLGELTQAQRQALLDGMELMVKATERIAGGGAKDFPALIGCIADVPAEG